MICTWLRFRLNIWFDASDNKRQLLILRTLCSDTLNVAPCETTVHRNRNVNIIIKIKSASVRKSSHYHTLHTTLCFCFDFDIDMHAAPLTLTFSIWAMYVATDYCYLLLYYFYLLLLHLLYIGPDILI